MTDMSEECPCACDRAKPHHSECPDCGAEMQPDDEQRAAELAEIDEMTAQGAEIDARAEAVRGGW